MDFGYTFKKEYIEILKKEYKNVYEVINYNDIKEISDKYNSFIRKIMYIIKYDNNLNSSKFRELFTSNNILDRLKGLKDSRKYIKLVEVKDVN